MHKRKLAQVSFTTLLFSVVTAAICLVVALLMIPAYQGSQKALSEEIRMLHHHNQRVLGYMLEQQLSNIARMSYEITQKSELRASLLADDLLSVQMLLDESVQGSSGEKIDLLIVESTTGKQAASTPFALFGLDINYQELTGGPAMPEQWSSYSTTDGLSFLKLKLPVVHPGSGRVLGYLYTCILVNDNFWILNEIQTISGTDAVAIIHNGLPLARLTDHAQQDISVLKADMQQQPFLKVDGGVLFEYHIPIADNEYSIRTLQPDTGLQMLKQAYIGRLGTTALTVLAVSLLIFYILRSLLRSSLHRIVQYAEQTASMEQEQAYPGNDFKEFSRVGQAISEMARLIKEREHRLNAVIQNATGLIAIKGKDLKYQTVNARIVEMTGRNDMIGLSDKEVFSESFANFLQSTDRLVLESGQPCQYEMDLVGKDGIHTYLTSKFPLKSEDGAVFALGSIATDITEQRKDQQRLELTSQVFQNTAEGIVIFDEQMNCLLCNKAFTELTGYEQNNAGTIGNQLLQQGEIKRAILARNNWQGETLQRRKDNSAFPAWLSVSAVQSAPPIHTRRYSLQRSEQQQAGIQYVIVISDISQLREAQERLVHIANYDAITGLPNRSLFFDRFEQSISRAARNGQPLALLYIDINQFKQINDQYGHQEGDQLLKECASRIRGCLEQGDTLSRINADEYLVLIENSGRAHNNAEQIASQIVNQFRAPFLTHLDDDVHVSASIGVALYPSDGEETQTLFTHADVALFQAKNSSSHFQFYDGSVNEQAEKRLTLERGLKKAIQSDDQLTMHFQPKYTVDGCKMIGTEALVRWIHPDEGFIPPDQFIGIAEESELIIRLGRKVLQMSCRAAKNWLDAGYTVPVAVNLSPRQLLDQHLLADIDQALQESGLPVEYLELEITETVVIEDIDRVISILKQLRNKGIRISVDDFGTGYSSLIYLKRLPVDTVKIDRSFLEDVPGDPDDESLIRAIINMSHSLGLQVISEGVETEAQQRFLQIEGCDELQGYLLSRPLPEKDLLALLQTTEEALPAGNNHSHL